MTDVSITAANVVPTGTYAKSIVTYGETITAGQSLYLKASDGKYWKTQCDGTAEEAAAGGIALVGGGANQLGVLLTSGTLTIGGTLVAGRHYAVSRAAGGICPESDLVSTDKVTILGLATTTAIINVNINVTGPVGKDTLRAIGETVRRATDKSKAQGPRP